MVLSKKGYEEIRTEIQVNPIDDPLKE